MAVCTRGDSALVERCLSSLSNQKAAEGFFFSDLVLVVNSSSETFHTVKDSVERAQGAAANSLPQLRVVHEPTIGIPFARNRALTIAEELEADWLAFTDDDCVADPNWLFELTRGQQKTLADVLAGSTSIEPHGPVSDWCPLFLFGMQDYLVDGKIATEGSALTTAFTRNVMFRMGVLELLPPDQRRFSEALSVLSVGEDSLFFHRVRHSGGSLVYWPSAKVTEYYSGDRLLLRWHLQRRVKNAKLRRARRQETGEKLVTRAEAVEQGLRGSIFLILLPFFLLSAPFSPASRKVVGATMWRLAPLLGLVRKTG